MISNQMNSPHRILVVDDEGDSRQFTVEVLTGSGYEAEGVKDGAAGWKALQNNSYDLIITDNKMPKMTGIEMLEKLYATRMTIPVIMATGILPTHEFDRKPWLRPAVTLQKPFSIDDLLATVKKILNTNDGRDDHKQTLPAA